MRMIRRFTLLLFALCYTLPTISHAQRSPQNLTPEEREKLIAKRNAIEQELESTAIIDRKVMVKMPDGYSHKPVWMEPSKVYKVELGPMNTSNYFGPGHRIRIEVSGSNFPRFDRNMNTGGNNYDETAGRIAHTEIHHSAEYPSAITLSVVKH
jgi:predicted acyl esterase